ncbi:GIY-YIG nuclease family protein [Methylobacterium sp. AMS5]|uniref:GIY-YIG nuclease family protein n=1 Tax=Methylobacterium sp. AMS5 TaxID=925818 RepID=UPI00074FA534|nr:GIY-YIG nuclease family protein [Methylobacterium sp. AMS5]AMB48240.1 hypothetical protein Y590_25060 [Methylobacterium sp. AMS5]
MTQRLSGVYAIIHLASGRHYIGSAVHITRRWSVHRAYLARGAHQNSYLQRAWTKHGPEAFGFFILELADPDRLIEVEQEWIDRYWHKGLYNRRRDARSNLGVRHSEASRAKMREIAKGRVPSEACRDAQRSAAVGREQTDEEKQRRREALVGRSRPAEVIERIRKGALARTDAHQTAIGARTAKTYLVTDPDGLERSVTNLRAFCADHGLQQGHMVAVSKGKRSHHKGWTARLNETPSAERYNESVNDNDAGAREGVERFLKAR